MTMKTLTLSSLVVPLLLAGVSVRAAAQDPIFDAAGFIQNRGYATSESGERVDTRTGLLSLSYSDLDLPGNAGRSLKFTRTYNSKSGFWTFGIEGLYLTASGGRIYAPAPLSIRGPVFDAHDGGVVGSYVHYPGCPVGDECRFVVTRDFSEYDQIEHRLYSPDGTVSIYDDRGGKLIEVADRFGNHLTFEWQLTDVPNPSSQSGTLIVRQDLGQGQVRVITIGVARVRPLMFSSMEFDGLHWTYTHEQVSLPMAKTWTYTYGMGDGTPNPASRLIVSSQSPEGTRTDYRWQDHEFQRYPPEPPPPGCPELFYNCPLPQYVHSDVLHTRSKYDRSGAQVGTWTYEYEDFEVIDPIKAFTAKAIGRAISPEGVVTEDFYNPADGLGGAEEWVAIGHLVRSPAGEIQRESIEYQERGHRTNGANVLVKSREVKRDNRTYTTTYNYGLSNYSDFGHPNEIVESGELQRTTLREFDYGSLTVAGRPVFLGKVGRERVRVGDSQQPFYEKVWVRDPFTGFITRQTIFGLETSFERDNVGNIQSVTKDGHTTELDYDWGVVSGAQTALTSAARDVSARGLVTAETKNGITTQFHYDDLFRVIESVPPGSSESVRTTYASDGAWVRIERGDAVATTVFDALGRPMYTANAEGVQTTVVHDTAGHPLFESLPFYGDPQEAKRTELRYDALGRLVRRINPGGTEVVTTYGPGTVAIRDENGNTTTQEWKAFGSPDDKRLTSVTDATGNTWQYQYNALGKLTKITAPGPVVREWRYDDAGKPELLTSEKSPEAGEIFYTYYPGTSLIKTKLDARQTTYTFYYDANGRLSRSTAAGPAGFRETTIGYESGTDNRSSATIAGVDTQFRYDDSGRLRSRKDTVNGRAYTQTYSYDRRDNLQRIDYGGGSKRSVEFRYDDANRVTSVVDMTGSLPDGYVREYVKDIEYHPSGAMTSYVTGNGLVHRLDYDENRL